MGDSAGFRPGLHRRARVVEKARENPRTVSLVLDISLRAVPGQFAMLWLPDIDEKPFSIAGDDPLQFTISAVGPFSSALQRLQPGDALHVRGPFGKGFSVAPGRALLVGGGYGAAPLHYLAQALLAAGGKPEAVIGARTDADLLFMKRFSRLGVPAHATTEDGSTGIRGMVPDAVAPLLASGRFDRLCACGPEAMLESLAALCARARMPAELSREAYMRCGIGICGSCECEAGLVCMDGPVFSVPGGR